MQPSYLHISYSKFKLFLIFSLAVFTIFTASYQIKVSLFSKAESGEEGFILSPLEKIFSPQNVSNPTPTVSVIPKPFLIEQEEEIITEVKNMPIKEVREQLLQKAPEELKKLIKAEAIPEETMRELLIIMSNP